MHKDISGKEELEELKKKVEGDTAEAASGVKSDAESIEPAEKQRIIDDVVARITAMDDEELQAMVAGMEADSDDEEPEAEEPEAEETEESKKAKGDVEEVEEAKKKEKDPEEDDEVEEAKKKEKDPEEDEEDDEVEASRLAILARKKEKDLEEDEEADEVEEARKKEKDPEEDEEADEVKEARKKEKDPEEDEEAEETDEAKQDLTGDTKEVENVDEVNKKNSEQLSDEPSDFGITNKSDRKWASRKARWNAWKREKAAVLKAEKSKEGGVNEDHSACGSKDDVEEASLHTYLDSHDWENVKVGSQLNVHGKWCVVDEISGHTAYCIDDDGGDITVDLSGSSWDLIGVSEARRKKASEKETEKEENVDMEEDLAALISGEANLTEAFKEKAKVIFESAVNTKFQKERNRLMERYAARAKVERANIKAELTEQVDSYLNYVVESWMKENKLAVQTGLRTEAAEKFISSLKSVFAENYIELPAGKTTVLEELNDKLANLTEQLAASKVDLKQSLGITQSLQRKAILAEASKGLASTEAERLMQLTADSKFESAEAFKAKVAIVKESYFRNKPASIEKSTVSGKTTTHVIIESGEPQVLSYDMKNYVSAISRVEANNPNAKA